MLQLKIGLNDGIFVYKHCVRGTKLREKASEQDLVGLAVMIVIR
jgi:hypothetical protein